MTDFEAIKLPYLIIAPDGWVHVVRGRGQLATWNARGVRTYNRIGLFLLDAEGRGWRLVSIRWTSSSSAFRRLIAQITGRSLPSVLQFAPAEEDGLATAKRLLAKALDDDDDLLTQFTELRTIQSAIGAAPDAPSLMRSLSELRVVE
jgi:hypothetical protein